VPFDASPRKRLTRHLIHEWLQKFYVAARRELGVPKADNVSAEPLEWLIASDIDHVSLESDRICFDITRSIALVL
jgi:hypothetical protein